MESFLSSGFFRRVFVEWFCWWFCHVVLLVVLSRGFVDGLSRGFCRRFVSRFLSTVCRAGGGGTPPPYDLDCIYVCVQPGVWIAFMFACGPGGGLHLYMCAARGGGLHLCLRAGDRVLGRFLIVGRGLDFASQDFECCFVVGLVGYFVDELAVDDAAVFVEYEHAACEEPCKWSVNEEESVFLPEEG